MSAQGQVTMQHPGVDGEITVRACAAAAHERAGWTRAPDSELPAPDDGTDQDTRQTRRRRSAGTDTTGE